MRLKNHWYPFSATIHWAHPIATSDQHIHVYMDLFYLNDHNSVKSGQENNRPFSQYANICAFQTIFISRKLFLCLSQNYLLIFMRICFNFEEPFCRVTSHDLKWQFMNRYITKLLFVHTVYKYKLLYTCTWTLIGISVSITANATFVSSSNISNLLLSWTSPHSGDSASKNLKSVIRWSLPRRFKRQNFSMPSHISWQQREQSINRAYLYNVSSIPTWLY